MKIRGQLSLAIVGCVMFSFAAAVVFGVLAGRQIVFALMTEATLPQTAKLLAVSVAGPVEHREIAAVERDLEAASRVDGIAYACVLLPDGKVIKRVHPDFTAEPGEKCRPTPGPFEIDEPVRLSDGRTAAVRVGRPGYLWYGLLLNVATAFIPLFFRVGLVAAVLSLGAGLLIARRLARPVRELAMGAARVASGDLSVEIHVKSSNELGDLAMAFNAMTRKLKTLDELKDGFIAHVSHDLRSPMAAIKMYADYMLNHDPKRETLLPEQRKMLGIIIDNSMQLNVFVTNVLDAAKMKAGKMEYHPQPVALERVAGRIKDLYAIVASQQGVELRVDVPAGTPAALADPERLEQVVANLVSNALKFTRSGGQVPVGARAAAGRVELQISDTGKGMSKEDLDRLFKPFEQTDVAAQKAEGIHGTGLGLYIVKQTVEAMGGRVTVASEPGKGARFTLELPVAAAVAAPAVGRVS